MRLATKNLSKVPTYLRVNPMADRLIRIEERLDDFGTRLEKAIKSAPGRQSGVGARSPRAASVDDAKGAAI